MRSFRIGAELTLVGDGTSVSVEVIKKKYTFNNANTPDKTLTDSCGVSDKHSSFKRTEQSKLFCCSWYVPRVEPMAALGKKSYTVK